jgi:hypothetical protein
MGVLITVDGVDYNVRFPAGGIKRRGRIADGPNAGKSRAGGAILDTLGTFYDYTLRFLRDGYNVEEYDALYEVLTDPTVREHSFSLPYGQTTLTFDAYVTAVDDDLSKQKNGVNYWSGMSVEVLMLEPQRTPY